MYLARVQGTEETSARAALRRASDASHQRMHDLEPFAQIAAGTLPIIQYRLLLQALFRFHSAIGEASRRSVWGRLSSAPQRLDLLRSDLAVLGGAVPEPVCDWQAGTGEAMLGALYVAEGSMLGGRVIARQLDYAFGSNQQGRRFFSGDKGDRANWSALLMVLEDRCTHPGPLSAAISGTCQTFDWFEQCVCWCGRPQLASAARSESYAGKWATR